MSGKAVVLNVAGESCRVVTTADEQELQALAALVEEKLSGVLKPGRPVTTQAVLLAAVALANDLQDQRARADAIADKAKHALRAMLVRVDDALEQSDTPTSERSRKRGGSPKSKRSKSARSDEASE